VALVATELFWAWGSILTKRLALPPSSAMTAAGQMIVGGALLLVCAIALGERPTAAHPAPAGLAAMAYMVVAGSIIAYSAYVWLLGRASATRLASYTYVNPVVALVIGYLVAGERLTGHAVYGSALVLLSVVLVLRATRGREAPASAEPRQGPELASAAARGT
jgi:drug/metabolite transporter (DMT)-like permease